VLNLFASWCPECIAEMLSFGRGHRELGDRMTFPAASQSGSRNASVGLADPRSWFWPACSPDGRWVAATDSYNQKESANHTIPRALWLLASDGSSRRLLVPGTNGAVEFPRWSSDGTVILVVLRTGSRWSSPGSLLLVRVDPTSGRLVKLVGPIVDLGSAPGPGGHQQWSAISDWYRR
jgi:hypothetical protein